MAHRSDLVSRLDGLQLLELLLKHVHSYLHSQLLHHFTHFALRIARELFAFLNDSIQLLPCWRLVDWLLVGALVKGFDRGFREVLEGLRRVVVGGVCDGLVEMQPLGIFEYGLALLGDVFEPVHLAVGLHVNQRHLLLRIAHEVCVHPAVVDELAIQIGVEIRNLQGLHQTLLSLRIHQASSSPLFQLGFY